MKMLMLIVEGSHRERVEATLTEQHVMGYTEIPTVYGSGRTGPRLGSRAFPESSSIIFTVVEDEKVEALLERIRSSCPECPGAMHTIIWAVEKML